MLNPLCNTKDTREAQRRGNERGMRGGRKKSKCELRKGIILRIQQTEYERAREIKRHPGIAAEHKSETKRARESNRNQGEKIKSMSKSKTHSKHFFEQPENVKI